LQYTAWCLESGLDKSSSDVSFWQMIASWILVIEKGWR
jgi:hypothetical protein